MPSQSIEELVALARKQGEPVRYYIVYARNTPKTRRIKKLFMDGNGRWAETIGQPIKPAEDALPRYTNYWEAYAELRLLEWREQKNGRDTQEISPQANPKR